MGPATVESIDLIENSETTGSMQLRRMMNQESLSHNQGIISQLFVFVLYSWNFSITPLSERSKPRITSSSDATPARLLVVQILIRNAGLEIKE